MSSVFTEGLVSIVSPCYNVGKYLPRFLDSLLQQTYGKIHVVLVNDGSQDDTAEVIAAYVPLLMQKGYEVEVLHQTNQGQSAALQAGMQHIKGEFFTWPDPDDWLYPESLARRVEILQKASSDVALLRCNADMVDERNEEVLDHFLPVGDDVVAVPSMFRDLLLRKTFYAPVCNMVRTELLREAIPDFSIYVQHNAGQNYQLMLPAAYRFRTLQTGEILGAYLVRKTSHSRNQHSYEKRYEYEHMCDTVVTETLARMGLAGSKWDRQAHALSLVHHYRIARRCQRPQIARDYLKELKNQGFSARCIAWAYSLCDMLGKSHWNDNPQSYLNRGLSRLGIDYLPPY